MTDVDPDAHCLYVDAAKDDIESRGWEDVPTSSGSDCTTGARQTAEGMGVNDGATAENRTSVGMTGRATADRTSTEDTLRVPVHEERLRAGTRETEGGEVAINRNVVQERQDLDVPVTHEEVDIRRVKVDRSDGGADEAFRDGESIRVPLRAETVEVTKEPRVVEEIEISKRPVTETQRVSDTVRREEVTVDDDDRLGSGLEREPVGSGSGVDRMSATDLDEESDMSRDRGVDWTSADPSSSSHPGTRAAVPSASSFVPGRARAG